MIHFIIKAFATKSYTPDYFSANTRKECENRVRRLADSGWFGIEVREIINPDTHIEGVLKRCKVGGERQRANLQVYYNEQPKKGGGMA